MLGQMFNAARLNKSEGKEHVFEFLFLESSIRKNRREFAQSKAHATIVQVDLSSW